MGPWLQSGRRRDCCYLLAEAGELRGQALKTRLETHYGERIDPKSFYGSLSALVDAGHVESREAGLHDVYALTDAGEDRLRAHHAWARSCVDARTDE